MTVDVRNLAALLETGSPAERLDAAEKLAQLESDARDAAVPLVEACQTEDDQLRDWVVAALEALGPPAAGEVAKLASLVEHESLDTAYWACTLLGRLELQAAPAVPALAKTLGNHADLVVRQRAAWALGKIGPAAGAARGDLQQAADAADSRLARLAREALDRL